MLIRLLLLLGLCLPALGRAEEKDPSWRFWAWAAHPDRPLANPPFVAFWGDDEELEETGLADEWEEPAPNTLSTELCFRVLDPCDWACHGSFVPHVEWGLDSGGTCTQLLNNWWMPFLQGHDWVVFGEARLMLNSRKHEEAGIGFGMRTLLCQDTLFGTSFHMDFRHTDRHFNFPQVALGAEILTENVEFRVQSYLMYSEHHHFTGSAVGTLYEACAHLAEVYDGTQPATEHGMNGVDVELGFHTPLRYICSDYDWRFYGGLYYFDQHHVSSLRGGKFRTEFEWRNEDDPCSWLRGTLTLDGELTEDEARGLQSYVGLRWRVPLAPPSRSQRLEGLRHSMQQRVARDWHL